LQNTKSQWFNNQIFTLPSNGYNPTVDYARMAAAIVIVLFHSKAPLGQFGEAAVGVFVVFMVMFSLNNSQKSQLNTLDFLTQRGIKLIRPYLIWTLIYSVMFIAQAAIKGLPFFESIVEWMPPSGSQRQLWFLPWAFAVCIALNFTISLTFKRKLGPNAIATLIAFVIVVSACSLYIWTHVKLPLFIALCILYIPSVLLGGLIYIFRRSQTHLALVAFASIFGACVMDTAGFKGTMQLAIGVPLSILAMCIKLPAISWSKRLNQLSMDVYLVHIAALSLIVQLTPFEPNTWLGGVIVVLLSIAISLPLQIPLLARWTH
jgi:peptidoglycan/LPS O-acetylase OafA/YrhL